MHVHHASPELIVTLYRQGHSRDDSASPSCVLDLWTRQSVLLAIGRPTKRTHAIKAFIERRTLEAAHLGNEALAGKISDEYATSDETGT
jgi:hypothetical protein